jgi:hypothetical protein
LTPDPIKQKYPQTVVSTRIVPGCVQFLRKENVFTQPGSLADLDARKPNVRFTPDCVAKLPLMRIANRDSVGGDGIGGSGA